jgi:hypothetical protein
VLRQKYEGGEFEGHQFIWVFSSSADACVFPLPVVGRQFIWVFSSFVDACVFPLSIVDRQFIWAFS